MGSAAETTALSWETNHLKATSPPSYLCKASFAGSVSRWSSGVIELLETLMPQGKGDDEGNDSQRYAKSNVDGNLELCADGSNRRWCGARSLSMRMAAAANKRSLKMPMNNWAPERVAQQALEEPAA